MMICRKHRKNVNGVPAADVAYCPFCLLEYWRGSYEGEHAKLMKQKERGDALAEAVARVLPAKNTLSLWANLKPLTAALDKYRGNE